MHGAYETTLKLLEREDIPTCILYPDDYASYGGIRAINEKGLKVPEDISIIGYDGIRVARHIRPRLTTYRQNTDEMGTQAARNLIDLIERPNTTLIKQVVIKGNLLEGDTLKKLD
jgi:LacI family transcriptional regulator/LacI family purine nucleotide synthesis repressor